MLIKKTDGSFYVKSGFLMLQFIHGQHQAEDKMGNSTEV